MSLELIIRPFQSVDVTPPARVIDPAATPAENVVLAFGQEGAIKTLQGSFSSSISSYTDDHSVELSRDVEVKRITNPDDESQHVDVEVINKLTMEKGTGKEYKKTVYDFTGNQGAGAETPTTPPAETP